MKKEAKIFIKYGLLITYICLLIVATIRYFSIWYGSNDARYVKDNFEYLTQRMDAIDLIDQQSVKAYPYAGYPMVLQKLAEFESSWTDSYLASVQGIKEETGKLILTGDTNPYDTLARLKLTANVKKIQTVYTSIQFDAAILNPDDGMAVLDEWLDEREQYRSDAYEALDSLLKQYYQTTIFLVALYGIFFSALFLSLFSFLFRKIRQKLATHNLSHPTHAEA